MAKRRLTACLRGRRRIQHAREGPGDRGVIMRIDNRTGDAIGDDLAQSADRGAYHGSPARQCLECGHPEGLHQAHLRHHVRCGHPLRHPGIGEHAGADDVPRDPQPGGLCIDRGGEGAVADECQQRIGVVGGTHAGKGAQEPPGVLPLRQAADCQHHGDPGGEAQSRARGVPRAHREPVVIHAHARDARVPGRKALLAHPPRQPLAYADDGRGAAHAGRR